MYDGEGRREEPGKVPGKPEDYNRKKFAELIIVDTGSVDGTMDIAREYTDRVYQHPWNNDFSDMRNITIGYAKGEWVFIVDADEQLENPEEVIRLFESNETEKYNTISVRLKKRMDRE